MYKIHEDKRGPVRPPTTSGHQLTIIGLMSWLQIQRQHFCVAPVMLLTSQLPQL